MLLAVGSVLGILLGIASALNDKSGSDLSTLPADAIALVNSKPIRAEEYAHAVTLLANDKRTEITDEDRAHVLNRLIEEELLIQHGVESGLVDVDRTLRKTITKVMLDAVVAESASEQPSEDALRAFYTENFSLFVFLPPESDMQFAAEKKVPKLPTFADIREQVEAEYVRRSRDNALREYLQWLHNEAKIVFAPEVLQ